MKYISLSLLLTLVAFACTPADKTTPPASTTPSAAEPLPVPVELPASFYKKLQGTVGDIAITMDLMRRDSTLRGTYFYEKVGLPLTLSGSLSATGAVTMAEYVGQGDETGSFEGKFSDILIIDLDNKYDVQKFQHTFEKFLIKGGITQ